MRLRSDIMHNICSIWYGNRYAQVVFHLICLWLECIALDTCINCVKCHWRGVFCYYSLWNPHFIDAQKVFSLPPTFPTIWNLSYVIILVVAKVPIINLFSTCVRIVLVVLWCICTFACYRTRCAMHTSFSVLSFKYDVTRHIVRFQTYNMYYVNLWNAL